MKKVQFIIVLLISTLILSIQVQGKEPQNPCGAPFTKGKHKWCICFHRYLINNCIKTSGDHIVCTDTHLRQILQHKINIFIQHYKQDHPQKIRTMPMYTLSKYFSNCPIIKSSYEKSKSFVIQNMNITQKTKLPRHVIIFGLDGVRRDVFIKIYQSLKKENHDKYFLDFVNKVGINSQFYAGGKIGTKSQQKTLSEAGWVTILTGVWAYQHGAETDNDIQSGKYNHNIPTIYNIIHQAYPKSIVASFSDWKAIATFASYSIHGNDKANINYYYDPVSFVALPYANRQMTFDISRSMKLKVVPTFIYAHYDYSDDSGHFAGFSLTSSLYVAAIRHEIHEINSVLNTIFTTQKEPWLIIITTDHGGHDHEHGTQKPSDRNIFAVIGVYQQRKFKKYPIANAPKDQTYFVKLIKDYLFIGEHNLRIQNNSIVK